MTQEETKTEEIKSVETSIEEPVSETQKRSVEEISEGGSTAETAEVTKPSESSEPAKKRKHKRRRYEDLSKEEPESDEKDGEELDKLEDKDDEKEDDEDDDLLEIDESNIITTGRRTRGKVINFVEAAKEIPEDDEEDDGEFGEREAELEDKEEE